MRKRILVIASAVLVFGLAIAVYAFNTPTTSNAAATKAACCCCSGDSCPMKDKNVSAAAKTDTATKHENCDCCGDSCPMKKGDAAMAGMRTESSESCPMMKASADGNKDGVMKMENGESCPMMKGNAAIKAEAGMKNETKAGDGKSCCCPCCSKKGNMTADAPAV